MLFLEFVCLPTCHTSRFQPIQIQIQSNSASSFPRTPAQSSILGQRMGCPITGEAYLIPLLPILASSISILSPCFAYNPMTRDFVFMAVFGMFGKCCELGSYCFVCGQAVVSFPNGLPPYTSIHCRSTGKVFHPSKGLAVRVWSNLCHANGWDVKHLRKWTFQIWKKVLDGNWKLLSKPRGNDICKGWGYFSSQVVNVL